MRRGSRPTRRVVGICSGLATNRADAVVITGGQLVVGLVIIEPAAAGAGAHHRGDDRGDLPGQGDERGVAALAEERGDVSAVDVSASLVVCPAINWGLLVCSTA